MTGRRPVLAWVLLIVGTVAGLAMIAAIAAQSPGVALALFVPMIAGLLGAAYIGERRS